MEQWQAARTNIAAANQLNPLYKLTDDKDDLIAKPKGSKNSVVQQNTKELQTLDEMLPSFEDIDTAIERVKQQDAELEDHAAKMINKV